MQFRHWTPEGNYFRPRLFSQTDVMEIVRVFPRKGWEDVSIQQRGRHNTVYRRRVTGEGCRAWGGGQRFPSSSAGPTVGLAGGSMLSWDLIQGTRLTSNVGTSPERSPLNWEGLVTSLRKHPGG